MDPAWLAPADRSKPSQDAPARGTDSRPETESKTQTEGWEVVPPRTAAGPRPSRPPSPGPNYRADWELAPDDQPSPLGKEAARSPVGAPAPPGRAAAKASTPPPGAVAKAADLELPHPTDPELADLDDFDLDPELSGLQRLYGYLGMAAAAVVVGVGMFLMLGPAQA